MSEEEKKAIDILKHYVNNVETHNFEKTKGFQCVKTVLNLIEKYQKELEQEQEKEKNEKVKLYIQEKQKIQYKYALSKIECEDIMELLEE